MIPVNPHRISKEWDCHNNTIKFIDLFGWERIMGYYLLYDNKYDKLVGIMHSVIKKYDNLIDITPFSDGRSVNLFGKLPALKTDYSSQEIWEL
jgi:hypothetical protein